MVRYDSDRDLLWNEIERLVEENKLLKQVVQRQEQCVDIMLHRTEMLNQQTEEEGRTDEQVQT